MQNVSDVTFKINSGDHKGEVYRFTLALHNGEKQWAVTPIFKPAPSMLREQIYMVLAARSHNIPNSGAQELKQVSQILEDLRTIAEEEYVTLTGLDKEARYVRVPQDGYSVMSIVGETGRNPEYQVQLTCWGLYKWE